jgi:molybdopterin converting factor subunit 1
MMQIQVQYYAILREQAGTSEERVQTSATTPAGLYDELVPRHGFTLARSQLRVAIDGDFASWDAPLTEGAKIVFIPPVAGG